MDTLQTVAPRPAQTIVRRGTRYAIECVIDGQVTVIGYTSRPSKMAMILAGRKQADAILPFLTESDKCHYAAGVLSLGARVQLRMGDTERRDDAKAVR